METKIMLAAAVFFAGWLWFCCRLARWSIGRYHDVVARGFRVGRRFIGRNVERRAGIGRLHAQVDERVVVEHSSIIESVALVVAIGRGFRLRRFFVFYGDGCFQASLSCCMAIFWAHCRCLVCT